MPLRERIFARFHDVATGTLRLEGAVADVFASHVADAHSGLHVISTLCTAPNALQSSTLAAMLERWFRLLPQYAMPASVLGERKKLQAAPFASISEDAGDLLQARVLAVCISERHLPEPQALVVAAQIRKAASAFFALEQRCLAPEEHSQRALCGTLKAALDAPLQHATNAAHAYLGENV